MSIKSKTCFGKTEPLTQYDNKHDAQDNADYINKKFTAFVKINNLLNSDYARQANFNVQGFQVLGGVSYKFDF